MGKGEWTMLLRQDPFREMDRWAQQFGVPVTRPSIMGMDAYRRGDDFIVNFDLPGVDPSSIDVTVEQNTLTVKAERRWTMKDDDEILISERPQGSFSRQVMRGAGLDVDKIHANYELGVLSCRQFWELPRVDQRNSPGDHVVRCV
jgi:HSP20 family protein